MAVRRGQKIETPETEKSKQDWIQSAACLQAERFEVAGALFDTKNDEMVAESVMKKRLKEYRGGGSK